MNTSQTKQAHRPSRVFVPVLLVDCPLPLLSVDTSSYYCRTVKVFLCSFGIFCSGMSLICRASKASGQRVI